ncbi:MAG: hypothetical protein JSS71_12430 [Armatimonadetes bacterium]|nr:hypothetical protein [Armatimonadota bacterium]MBX3109169.1 hypothetical protein [Fimbriimonadaceae bacterium]
MTLSLLAAALIGTRFAPAQDAKLDLAVPGATLSAISQEVGAQLGARVILDPSVANDLAVVWLKGKPASEVLAKIGEVTATKWTLAGDVLTVTPDMEARNREFAKVRAKNTEAILKARKAFFDNLQPKKYKDEDGKEYEYDAPNEQYLIGDLLRNVPEQTLISLAPGQRLVLSSRPTAMQRPLGRFDSKRVMDWIADTNKQFDQSEEEMQQMRDDPEYQQYMQIWGEAFMDSMPKKITEAPQKLLLILERDNESEFEEVSIHVVVRVQGASSKSLLTTEAWLGEEMGAYEVVGDAVAQQTTTAAPARAAGSDEGQGEPRKAMPGDEIPIEFSSDAMLLRDAWGSTNPENGMPGVPKMSRRTMELLADPVSYEPMRYEIGEVLMQAAEKRGLPLVAAMIDEIDTDSRDMPKTLGALRDELPYYEMDESEADGWWQFKLSNPAPNWAKRVDRAALAGLLKESLTRTFVSLDTLATFVYRFPMALSNTVSGSRLRLVAPQLAQSFTGVQDPSLLRFYGSMSFGERQRLKQNGSIPLGALSSEAQRELSRKFFGAGASLDPVDLEKDLGDKDLVQMISGSIGMGMAFGGMTGHEPTEAMPNGLPREGIVAMKVNKDDYLLPMGKEGGLINSLPPFGRAELAFFSLLMKNPEFMAQMDQFGEVLSYMRSGKRDNLHIAVLVAPKLGTKGTLSDMHEPDMAHVYSLMNLPPAMKQQMDADGAALQNSPFGKMFEQMGSMGGPSGPIKP